MSADPIERLPGAFGDVLVRHRKKRSWSVDDLAMAAGLSAIEVKGLERGEYGPTLNDVFRIATALREEPLMLLIDVVSAWRADSMDNLQKSRASDFARLFRLGCHQKPGSFRELSSVYYSVGESTHAAAKLNAQRHTRGAALLDTVCIYVRLSFVSLRVD